MKFKEIKKEDIDSSDYHPGEIVRQWEGRESGELYQISEIKNKKGNQFNTAVWASGWHAIGTNSGFKEAESICNAVLFLYLLENKACFNFGQDEN